MSDALFDIPALEGFTIRPPEMADADMAAELLNICSLEVTGKRPYNAQVFERTWQAPKFNKDKSVRLVLSSDGELAAYVEVGGHQEPHAQIGVGVEVHPDYREKGIGKTLLAWGEARAYEIMPHAPEGAQVVMTAACNQKDVYRGTLYQQFGMEIFRHFFQMKIEFDTPPEPPAFPAGIVIRPFDDTREVDKLAQTYLDSFQDHFGFSGQTLEDTAAYIRHLIEKDPLYDPELWFMAFDGEQLVGFSACAGKTNEDPLMGYVNVLGVVRAWRKRGLGMALLRHSFVELHKRGSQRVGLSVDASNLTGATRLYEKAGMHVKERYDLYQKVLREGEVIVKQ